MRRGLLAVMIVAAPPDGFRRRPVPVAEAGIAFEGPAPAGARP